ncbi:hypothetical protein DFR70_11996 [Nocardia tenerifensis]|uniref:Cytochrome P450 n=1 Tax=Nocardia tenerifensis TaxID=228006 RepID=A0A318KD79_9NOCA|nr:hypothetical protein [Nocardia tenerifensis]PXX56544.1 hypothetical protein DFR70_11996 [Nocardia tenerifensis]
MNLITDPDQVRATLINAPVPAVPAVHAPVGVAWLRAHVPRFSTGAEHERLRALVTAELDRLSPADLRRRAHTARAPLPHVRVLAEALGLQGISVEAVALVAAHYQPHEPQDPAADEAVAELVAACGGIADDATAARICLLVQACAATGALVANARQLNATGTAEQIIERTMDENPPLRSTRRVVDGEVVELDMRHPGLGFGAGPHACPGRAHAIALAAGIIEESA